MKLTLTLRLAACIIILFEVIMRKADREIKDRDEILHLLDECQTIRLALHDQPYPYIVPLSYGWELAGDKICIYFHCAKEGKKLEDLIATLAEPKESVELLLNLMQYLLIIHMKVKIIYFT